MSRATLRTDKSLLPRTAPRNDARTREFGLDQSNSPVATDSNPRDEPDGAGGGPNACPDPD